MSAVELKWQNLEREDLMELRWKLGRDRQTSISWVVYRFGANEQS